MHYRSGIGCIAPGRRFVYIHQAAALLSVSA